jgi:ferric-dicitrate binding protein FerR (iron transport regulator)
MSDERQRFQQWEQALRDRELAVRLRELELEVDQQRLPPSPAKRATPERRPQNFLRRFYKKIENVAKFLGIVVLVIVGIQIASWLAGTIILCGIIWMAYKIFFESD